MTIEIMDKLTDKQIEEINAAIVNPVATDDEDAPVHSYEYLLSHMVKPQKYTFRKDKNC